MKFIITRTSVWSDDCPVVANAKEEEFTYLDWRTVRSLKKAEECHWFKGWFDSGINHREEKGMVVCDRNDKVKRWTLEINSLDDICKLVNNVGDVIISKCDDIKEVEYKIEVYDGYRE